MYSSHDGYSGSTGSSWFTIVLRACNGCEAFDHFSRECPNHGVMVPLAQSVPPIRKILPPAKDGMHGYWGSFEGAYRGPQAVRIGDLSGAQLGLDVVSCIP